MWPRPPNRSRYAAILRLDIPTTFPNRAAMQEAVRTGKFATDARGVPDTATINMLRSSHKSFEAAVRRALPQWRYDSQGHVRFAVRFMGVETEQREARGAARSPDFVVEGAPVMPVIVVAQLDRAPVQRSPGSD